MKKDIVNKNDKGEYHGYTEWPWGDNTVKYRCNWKNDALIGYVEWHSIKRTIYVIS